MRRARELDADDFQLAGIVDVIEVQNGKKTGVGTPACAAREKIRKSMLLSRSLKSAVARPRIHSLKSPSTSFGPGT